MRVSITPRYDGSSGILFGPGDVGVTTRISFNGGISGSYSDTIFLDDILPTTTRYYPTPIIDENGGWKYQPIDLGLPGTIDAFPNGGGLPVEVEFDVANKTSSTIDVTVTNIIYDSAACLLYKYNEVIGDGTAYSRSVRYGNSVVAGYDWRTYYAAAYATNWELDAAAVKNGVTKITFTSDVPEGSYSTATLNSQYGVVTRNGYFIGGPQATAVDRNNTPHVPADLIYGTGINGVLIVPAFCVF